MIAGDYKFQKRVYVHRYDDMESSTVVPTIVVTASNASRNPIEFVPKDLIPLGEVIQRRPTNRAERRAMKKGKRR